MACRRCGTARRPAKDFCGSVNVSTRVKLVGSDVQIEKEGLWVSASVVTANCPQTPGIQLLKVVLTAAKKVGSTTVAQSREGKIMPLILLKSFLFGIVAVCSSCKGKGCPTCNNLGV